MKHYNKDWSYIPFQDRSTAYSRSIKNVQYLWVKPTYEPGEVWEWYGGGGDRVEIIKILETKQVLVKTVSEWRCKDITKDFDDENYQLIDITDGDYHLYHTDKWGYCENGTPSLRLRIK